MVDIDALCARCFSVRLHGRELRAPVPSAGTVRRILALSECPDGELIERQLDLAEELLSKCGDAGICREELERLPPSALAAVIREAAALAVEAASLPD